MFQQLKRLVMPPGPDEPEGQSSSVDLGPLVVKRLPSVKSNRKTEVTGDDYISNLHADVSYVIFSKLPPASLAALSSTCKTMNESVNGYLEHELSLLNFSTDPPPNRLLTPPEMTIRSKLVESRQPLLRRTFHPLSCWGGVRKSLAASVDSFPHLGNSRYIRKEKDHQLGREIIRLDSVCWLHWQMTFHDVVPGTYEGRIRMKLLHNAYWPDNGDGYFDLQAVFPTEASDPSPETELLVKQSIHPTWWKMIRDRKPELPVMTDARIVYDVDDWFYLVFRPVVVTKRCHIVFEQKDVENPFWKSGLLWDFAQIRKL